MIASNARSGPVPLPLGVGVMLGEMVVLSCGWGSAGSVLHSQVGSGEEGLSRCARGVWVIASNARFGPIPLSLGAGGGKRNVVCWGRGR